MAKFRGNIFTIARGSVGSMTFSVARDRTGKVQTARQRTVPINPNTPGQVSARDNLTDTVDIVRNVRSQVNQSVFDRSVSKLPAYQSLVSTYNRHKQIVGTDVVVQSRPPTTGQGPLAPLSFIGSSRDGANEYTLQFSRGSGDINASDELEIGVITREFPVVDINGDRFQSFNYPGNPASPVLFDMGGFPGADTGVLIFTFYQNSADYPGTVFSPVWWYNLPS